MSEQSETAPASLMMDILILGSKGGIGAMTTETLMSAAVARDPTDQAVEIRQQRRIR